MDRFIQRKNDMLGKVDKSAKASWDERTNKLCEKLNSSENYYTTSSCSGKCVILEEKTGKSGDYYLWTSHSLITFNELNEVIKEMQDARCKMQEVETENGGVEEGKVRESGEGLIKFKCDPPAIFVCCRDIDFAKELLLKAKNSGFKQSGIMITNKIIGVEIKSGERLEFPIMNERKALVGEEYLKLIASEANKKREVGWKKTGELILSLD